MNLGHCCLLCTVSTACSGINYFASPGMCELIGTKNISSSMDMQSLLFVKDGYQALYCTTAIVNSLPDSSITASSYFPDCEPVKSRFDATNGLAWFTATMTNADDYLQYNFGIPRMIIKLATRGHCGLHRWVYTYYIASSTDGSTYSTYDQIFTGNSDDCNVVENVLPIPLKNVKYLRAFPITSRYWKAMQMEVYGC